MISKELEKIGLNKNEAKVYLAALELGETTVARLAQKSKVKRSTVYLSIDTLKEQGLINTLKRQNKTLYLAEDPRIIKDKIEEKSETLSKIMPELMSFSNIFDKKPKIRYYEGKEPLKEIYKDTLNYPKQEISIWFPDKNYWQEDKYFSEYYVPRRMKKKIWIKALSPISEFNLDYTKLDEKQLRETRFVDGDDYKIKIQIILYGNNKIGIVSYEEEIGLIIESKNIFDAMRSMFNVMWRSSSKLEKNKK